MVGRNALIRWATVGRVALTQPSSPSLWWTWNGPVATTTWSASYCTVVQLDHVRAGRLADRPHTAAELDGQLVAAGVVGQVGGDLVTAGVMVRVTWEGEARKGVGSGRREQLVLTQ